MKLRELLNDLVIEFTPNIDISGLENDSRRIKPNDLFIAYAGVSADGRTFMQQACQAGAAAIVYDPLMLPDSITFPSQVPCISIPELSNKLAILASRFYGNPTHDLAVYGVTGTNGKTTIAFQLAQAYTLLGQKAAYIGTIGQGSVDQLQPLINTTPDGLCLQRLFHDYLNQQIQHVCMEVSSHALAQHRADCIAFKQAIYTNLSHEHLDYHQTMQAYAQAKAALFAVPSLQVAVINYDDAYKDLMIRELSSTCKKVTYGLQEGSDVHALDWDISMSHSELDIQSPWGRHHIQVNLLGKFNLYNSLAVYTSLLANDVPINKVIAVMSKLRASPGRMEVVTQKPCVIVDYAHTPDALENALSTLLQLKRGRLGVVFGCGGDRDKSKRPLMGRVASQYADFVIITSDNPRTESPAQIVDEVAEGLLPTTKAMKILDRKEAIRQALDMASEQDIILVAGKGHEDYQIIGKERFIFSDRDVVQNLVNVHVACKTSDENNPG